MSNTTNHTIYMDSRRIKLRMAGIRLAVCFLLLMLLIKISYIKITKGVIFETASTVQILNGSDNTERVLKPVRGFIYDRNYRHLAVSETVYNIILDVKVLNSLKKDGAKDTERIEKILTLTAFLLEKDLNSLRQIADDPRNANSNYVRIEFGVPYEKWSEIQKYIDEGIYYEVFTGEMTEEEAEALAKQKKISRFKLKCVHEEIDIRREYPRETFAPQVIGFIRANNDSFGLEKSYNTDLSGKPGRRFRTYSLEGYPGPEETPSVPGRSLVTTLDATIQDFAQTAADKALTEYKAQHAAMIVMDPHTGEVLAMAQSPSFKSNDPNNIEYFTDNWIKASWDLMTTEQKNDILYEHWVNFNISVPFEPGSIFKPMVIAAALEEGIINADDTYYCGGYKTVNGQNISCWIAAENGAHGSQTITQVLANSCNVALMDIAEKMGRDMFYEYRNDFGYGEKTGIDLPGENAVSDPWLMFSLDQLNPVELAASSFGQGFSATAIQAVTSFAALINGGFLMKPYIVSQVLDSGGNILEENKPALIRRVISRETSDDLRIMLNAVVSPEGTGRRAIIDGYNIGGKTGTGQQISNKSYEEGKLTLTFIAFLPVEDPQYIALAVINNPQESTEGSVSAAPMLRDALVNIIKYKNIRPSEEIKTAPEDDGGLPMPDYVGSPLAEATRDLNGLSLDYDCRGNGDIVNNQFPAADVTVTPGSEIILFLRSSGADLTTVPDVTGLTPDEAKAELYAADLSFANVYEIESPNITPAPHETPEGHTVIKQMPKPGHKVQKGTEVKLIIT